MKCSLGEDKVCELKELFTAMDARQRSFEDRQAKNEIKIANTEKHLAVMQKDMAATKAEFLSLASKVSVNTEQLIDIKKDIAPITEGVTDIRNALKPWLWLIGKTKWIITSVIAGWVLLMDGFEHLFHWLDKHQ